VVQRRASTLSSPKECENEDFEHRKVFSKFKKVTTFQPPFNFYVFLRFLKWFSFFGQKLDLSSKRHPMNHLPSYFGIYLFSYLIARCFHRGKAIRSIVIHLVTIAINVDF
jgi:hypothetical protein